MTDFGERVDLTANLASILRRYPFSTGLFREILQNSDDARATKQVFVLNRRQFGTQSLINEKLAHLQGPAFLAYNDAVFSDTDWEAIRTVSQSSKSADTEKIGKHGLGSRAYYHLTDNPQYLSGSHMAIFDPHRWAFEHGGWKQSLKEVASQYPDQLAPFDSLLRNPSPTNFPGTIVRLALRAAPSESRISSKNASADEIHDLLVEFINQELEISMLFLSHLTLIEIKEIDINGQERTLASVTASSGSRAEPIKSSNSSGAFTVLNRTIAARDWLVARASFPKDEVIDLLCRSLSASREWVAGEVEREKLRADIALAFPTNAPKKFRGRLFTYLPLPLITDFPCHIHGVFSLTDSRQNLRNPSETIMRQTADELAVAWNKLLFSTLIPRAWLAFLESIADGRSSTSVYHCLPPLQDPNTSGDAAYWTLLLPDVVQLAHSRNAPIWPVYNVGFGDPQLTIKRTCLTDGFVAGTQDDQEQLRALVAAGLSVVLPPSEGLRGVLLETCPSRELTPHNARPELVNSKSVRGLLQSQKDLIVEFLLRSCEVRELVDVPVFRLVSGQAVALEANRDGQQEVHVLLDEAVAELFGQFDADAINLGDVPLAARTLLVDDGGTHLNVRLLDRESCVSYIRSAQANFRAAWSWSGTVDWLEKLWRWVETCPFVRVLLPNLKNLSLLPTVTGDLRSVEDDVFLYSTAVTDSVRTTLSGLGFNILDPRIPSGFLEGQTPKLVLSLSSASDLLDGFGTMSVANVEDGVPSVLRGHLASCLQAGARLNNAQKSTLRRLPIHLVLAADGSTRPQSLLANHRLYCITSPADIALPLPEIVNVTFVHCTDDERWLIQQLDYPALASPLNVQRVLQLHVDHFAEQSPQARLTVLTYLVDHKSLFTPSMAEQLRASLIVRVGQGDRLLAPRDVVDPQCSIADIVPSWDASAIFNDQANFQTVSALASLRLLRRELDEEYVRVRIVYVTSSPPQEGLDLARRLLSTMDRTWFNCSDVVYDPDLAWIPTGEGLRRPRDCRDGMSSKLCDRVMPMLDMSMLQSQFLRKMLGWDAPLPLDTVVEQFKKILSETETSSRPEYLRTLTSQFGHRFKEMTPAQLDDVAAVARQSRWVLTSAGELQLPVFAVFALPTQLRGFSQISLDLAHRFGVKDFLLRMGCTLNPANDAIVDQLQQLQSAQASEQTVRDFIPLLQALDIPSLTAPQRDRLLVPGTDSRPCTVQDLFYNDLGSRAFQFESPSDRVQVHHAMPHTLCTALGIPSLGSLHLQPLDVDSENMREDLTTRIGNVLRSYDINQAFNEFLANAADAGAKKFNIMLDYGDDRRANASEVLCQNMAQFCKGPALVVHNDAEFTMEDIRGICRIGRGGKENKETTVGRFGLGALSFYHFSEVAMILSGTRLVLLDPSGRYLPADSRTNSYVVSVERMRGLYPGHLKLFHDLFGFQGQNDYNGTIIRLPLRTEEQAVRSALSRRSVSTRDVHDMLDRYQVIAGHSLFFIRVEEITAIVSRLGGDASTRMWSVTAQREDVQCGEDNHPYILDVRTDSASRFPRHTQSSWLVANSVIPPEPIPDWAQSVVNIHRLKQLSVALAARISPAASRDIVRTSNFHFFSSLPLPIVTSLPVHIHASFVLAEDRRNIRWDGDGTLSKDSEFNHWLLSSALPPLYLHAIELMNERFAKTPTPWPENLDRCPDSLSKAFVDAFYSDGHLLASSRKVFRGVTDQLLAPSTAVIRGAVPDVIKGVLHKLRPVELVELPRFVRSKVLSCQSVQKTSPQYLRDIIDVSREQFLAGYETTVSATDVEGVVRYVLSDDKESPIPAASLHGLPLCPLADGTLTNIPALEHGEPIYAGSWGNQKPWPLFPAARFLHPGVDQHLFLGKGWSIASWDDSGIVALLRSKIPESARHEVSDQAERKWILDFWRLFDSATDSLVNAVSCFPLIPTDDDKDFVSLNTATAFPAILPPTSTYLSNLDWLIDPLKKIGVLVVQVEAGVQTSSSQQFPRAVLNRFRSLNFTSERVLQILHYLNKDGRIQEKFARLSKGERTELANWLRDSIGRLPRPRNRSNRPEFIDVVPHLPIWPAFRGADRNVLQPLSDMHVRVLPTKAKPASSITRFLLGDPSLYFVECSDDMTRLNIANPMSLEDFSRLLKFHTHFRDVNSLGPYKQLLDIILTLGSRKLSESLRVPNSSLDLMNIRSMYTSDVPEFMAAFAYRREVFVHDQLRSYKQSFVSLGLRSELTFENFKECVMAVDEDFDKEDPEDRDRALVIYPWYMSQLPLSLSHDSNAWRQLDQYAFIPTHQSRRLGGTTSFTDTAFAQPLPLIVSPSKILRHEHSAIAWTQRALFHGTPDKKLFMADEVVGIPTVEEVVKHLRVLTTKIAPKHSRDSGLLSDIKATYHFLQGRHEQAEKFLLRYRNERLFLNVDAPESDAWEFLPASQIMFNVPDEDDRREVRAFLRPFKDLLLASGANEIKIPQAPLIPPSSSEGRLSRICASFDQQRRGKKLVDVVFRINGATALEDGTELWAHRDLLATASDHFNNLFCGESGFSESRAASVEEPVVMPIEDDIELRCVGLVLDHIYTGQFEESQDRECLLELLHLAHRWELADVQAKAEALLVPTITPGTYIELRDVAKEIGATRLLEKIAEFERENAGFLLGGDML